MQRTDRRLKIRREAYASMILALDHLERAWEAPETLPATMEISRWAW